jgi:integrase
VARFRLKGINTVHKRLANGTIGTYYYHRATGRRLPGQFGSPELIASYVEAEKSLLDRHAGTFNGLIRDYILSGEFGQLAKSTQGDYKRLLKYSETEFGDLPIQALQDRRVRAEFLRWRDRVAMSSGPRAADYRLSAISAMLTWAERRGLLLANHLKDFPRLYHSDRSDLIWLPDHIHRFMEMAPEELQRAIILALHTGQRQGDLLRLTWSAYDGTEITLRQSKSRRLSKPGRRVTIPCTRALRNMLDNLPRASTHILTRADGQPWKPYTFRHAWKEVSDLAGISGLHFHDLRGTAVTMLAEAGCTSPEIAAITGHTLSHVESILEKYLSRTRNLAQSAISKFENAARTEFANRLQTKAPLEQSENTKTKDHQ